MQATTTVVYAPNDVLFQGVIIFLAVFAIVIFYFRR